MEDPNSREPNHDLGHETDHSFECNAFHPASAYQLAHSAAKIAGADISDLPGGRPYEAHSRNGGT